MTADTSLYVPTTVAEMWTMIGALAAVALVVVTIGVVIVAWRGLNSLKLTQDSLSLTHASLELAQRDMVTRATRDARNCAIERCEEMAKIIIPRVTQLFAAAAAAKVPLFVNEISAVKFDCPDEVANVARAKEWVAKLPVGMQGEIIGALNILEGWSMHFNHGLADHEVALGPCGSIYLQFVMFLYGGAVAQRTDPSSGRYANVVKLFNLWYHQKSAEGKARQLGELSEEVKRLNTEGPKMPKPLGLEER